jgi:hypothetical protein
VCGDGPGLYGPGPSITCCDETIVCGPDVPNPFECLVEVDLCGECVDVGTDSLNSYGCCGTIITDCDGVCGGDLVDDECMICGGDMFKDYDTGLFPDGSCTCDGQAPADLFPDIDLPCDCYGNVIGCDGVCGSGLSYDFCGVCGGDNSTCEPPPSFLVDGCGVCGGDNSSCDTSTFNIFDNITRDMINDIDDSANQNWYGTNEFGNNYYYPVLPKLNRLGDFDDNLGYQNDNIPFGDKDKWDGDDKATATLTKITKDLASKSLLDMDLSEIEEKTVKDNSGNSTVGMLLDDYKIKFDSKTNVVKKQKPKNKMKLGKNKNKKAF